MSCLFQRKLFHSLLCEGEGESECVCFCVCRDQTAEVTRLLSLYFSELLMEPPFTCRVHSSFSRSPGFI